MTPTSRSELAVARDTIAMQQRLCDGVEDRYQEGRLENELLRFENERLRAEIARLKAEAKP